MAKGTLVDYDEVHKRALHAAAVLFLQKGYTATSIQTIASVAGAGKTAVMRSCSSKEAILCELVKFVLEGQFQTAKEILVDITDDPVLYYATETTLQLYMAESDEAVRDLYSAAYSLPESAELIRRAVSDELLGIVFKDYLPGLEQQDFYILEIASGGMMRGYMMAPCTPDFPIEKKVRSFLENGLRVYRVPDEKIQEAVKFVSQFDFPAIAKQTIDNMLVRLKQLYNKTE